MARIGFTSLLENSTELATNAKMETPRIKYIRFRSVRRNTLEIIRMTAVENDDNKVSEMIEALSVQIHYLIGRAQDMVPIEKEIEIIQKYVYLLNCRITCKVQLLVPGNRNEIGNIMIPKLILRHPHGNNGSDIRIARHLYPVLLPI